MAVRFTHKPSRMGKRVQALWDRLDEMAEADAKAAQLALEQNAGMKFDPNHRLSHYVTDRGRVEIGSSALSYARLLQMDGAALAAVYSGHFFGEDD